LYLEQRPKKREERKKEKERKKKRWNYVSVSGLKVCSGMREKNSFEMEIKPLVFKKKKLRLFWLGHDFLRNEMWFNLKERNSCSG
jgi:hypothetical protein